MEVKGRFVKYLPEESGVSKAGKEWKKNGFVIETDGNYSKTICFNIWGDRTALVTNLKVGEMITVKFDVESREYNGKYFSEIKAYAIELDQPTQTNTPQAAYQAKPIPDEPESDLPF